MSLYIHIQRMNSDIISHHMVPDILGKWNRLACALSACPLFTIFPRILRRNSVQSIPKLWTNILHTQLYLYTSKHHCIPLLLSVMTTISTVIVPSVLLVKVSSFVLMGICRGGGGGRPQSPLLLPDTSPCLLLLPYRRHVEHINITQLYRYAGLVDI